MLSGKIAVARFRNMQRVCYKLFRRRKFYRFFMISQHGKHAESSNYNIIYYLFYQIISAILVLTGTVLYNP